MANWKNVGCANVQSLNDLYAPQFELENIGKPCYFLREDVFGSPDETQLKLGATLPGSVNATRTLDHLYVAFSPYWLLEL